MADFVVTTPRRAGAGEEELARQVAASLGLPWAPRLWQSLDRLRARYGARGVLVVSEEGWTLQTPQGPLAYHPSMALIRIRTLRRGGVDPMVEAMELAPGMSLLDCTLGLGSDAVVASFVVGDQGRVVGLESVPVLAALVARGLQAYQHRDPELVAAMRRVAVRAVSYQVELPRLPDRSFDVVYFDPMFREPLWESASMVPLRAVADPQPLSPAALAEARRVARRRVVVKERPGSPEFNRLGVRQVAGSPRGRVAYGVLEP